MTIKLYNYLKKRTIWKKVLVYKIHKYLFIFIFIYYLNYDLNSSGRMFR